MHNIPGVEDSLIFGPCLCDDDLVMEFKNLKCVVRKKDCVVDFGKPAAKSCSVNIHRATDKTLLTPDITSDMLSVWHGTQTPMDRNAIKKMDEGDVVCSLEVTEARSTNN